MRTSQATASEAESRRILDRVSREAGGVRPGATVGALPRTDDDWAEVWGNRIGRVLGPVLLVGLVVWLVLFAMRGG